MHGHGKPKSDNAVKKPKTNQKKKEINAVASKKIPGLQFSGHRLALLQKVLVRAEREKAQGARREKEPAMRRERELELAEREKELELERQKEQGVLQLKKEEERKLPVPAARQAKAQRLSQCSSAKHVTWKNAQ